jgi:predicted metalloprotease with PDZ domain
VAHDYTREQYKPLLWWSEGVTDYYADVSNVRAGLWTEGDFVENVQHNIDQVDGAPEPWSAEDGSAATWIDEVFVNSSQLYYPKGSLLGLLLDVSIRDATNGAKSLDDVTRTLFTRFAARRRGFTTADLLALLRETGMPDVDGFYRRTWMVANPCRTRRCCPRPASRSSGRVTPSRSWEWPPRFCRAVARWWTP